MHTMTYDLTDWVTFNVTPDDGTVLDTQFQFNSELINTSK